ncbi:Kinesin-like protein 2 [Choanephora cucurbitarum]|uniref:Kinesin-like protein 2 n=1 Tax=Choanephora cucurbitarum TaxID=101091 RepID=A0A1C7NJE6_9FUNG|nr:Kinesin-like protein 2 [Choanephora cucurbitarum]
MNNSGLKRKSNTDVTSKRQKTSINQGPRIPVKSTLASRSADKRNSNQSVKRPSLASTSSSSRSSPTTPQRSTNMKSKTTSRITDPKVKLNQLQSLLEKTGEEVNEIEKLNGDAQSTVLSTESLLNEALQKVVDLENTVRTTKERHQEEIQRIHDRFALKNKDLIAQNDRHKSELDGFLKELEQLEQRSRETLEQLEDERKENQILKATKQKMESSFAEIDASLTDKRMKRKSKQAALDKAQGDSDQLSSTIQKQFDLSKELELSILRHEQQRRKDHDRLQELKGNIRVFCRVRPALQSSDLASIRFFGEDNESMEMTEQVSSTLGKSSTKSYTFTFDRVFSPECTQQDCFEEISQLVQSALDGYNVCIFAYGQTGSGKTFTMQGPSVATEETSGMIPRAVNQIYTVTQQLKQLGWEYTMEGQFLEIYNETIHDLLGDASSYGKIKHDIYHEKNGKTTVTDMTTVLLDSPSKVKMMLKKASQNRATGATNLNERSSRSHSVFTLRLTGVNQATGEQTTGLLNLIDLAGSERLSLSGSVGDRLKETQAINKSLSCLGDVIHALVNNKEGGHIPYRNSRLTYLLRNSLGGNCKTLMFVNVSPLAEHFGESLCSLRFATKVNSCHIGTIKKTGIKQ